MDQGKHWQQLKDRARVAAARVSGPLEVHVEGRELDPLGGAESVPFSMRGSCQPLGSWLLNDETTGLRVEITKDYEHIYLSGDGIVANGSPEGSELLIRIPWVAFDDALENLQPIPDSQPQSCKVAGRSCTHLQLTSDDQDLVDISIDDESGLVLSWSAIDTDLGARVVVLDLHGLGLHAATS